MQAKCRVPACPGEYEERKIVHATRRRGRLMVIDGVPADVCSFCGDTLFRPEAAEALDRFGRTPPAPVSTIPLYHYDSVVEGQAGSPQVDAPERQPAVEDTA